MTGGTRSADGVAVRYEAVGGGAPALVLVHGWSCDRGYWRAQLDHLSARHRVVAPDLAGHGESGTNRADWTMAAFGDDVAAVVEQLDLHDVVLVGHSMGGDAVVEAARRLGDRVTGVVWVDTYRSLGTPPKPTELAAFVEPFRENFTTATDAFVRGMFPPAADPALVDRIAADMASAPPELALPMLEQAFGNAGPVLDGLRALRVPVVALNADYRPTDTDSLAAHGVRTVILPGLGHFPMLEDPPAFERALAAVVAELGA